jgi:hypothetical protein
MEHLTLPPFTREETVQDAKQYPPKCQPPVLRTNQLRDLNFAIYLKHRTRVIT